MSSDNVLLRYCMQKLTNKQKTNTGFKEKVMLLVYANIDARSELNLPKLCRRFNCEATFKFKNMAKLTKHVADTVVSECWLILEANFNLQMLLLSHVGIETRTGVN